MTDKNLSSLVGNEAGDSSPADHRGQPSMLRRAGRTAFRMVLILGGLIFLFLLGMLLILLLSLEGMATFQEKLHGLDSALMFVRLLLIGLLIVFWYPLNSWLANRNCWSEQRLQQILAGRWWTLTLLLFIEIILVQRFHETLLDLMVN